MWMHRLNAIESCVPASAAARDCCVDLAVERWCSGAPSHVGLGLVPADVGAEVSGGRVGDQHAGPAQLPVPMENTCPSGQEQGALSSQLTDDQRSSGVCGLAPIDDTRYTST